MKAIGFIALHILPCTTDKFIEIDIDTIPWNAIQHVTEATADNGHIYDIFLYRKHYYAFDTYDPFAPAPGDLDEWVAASCGEC